MFIAGEPMKPATNRFAGLLNSSVGGATCWRLNGRFCRHGTQHRNPMTQRHRLDLIVRHIHRRGLKALVEPAQLGAHLHTQLRIQVGQRLIHQERLRLTHDGTTHRHTLTLTTRQRLRLAVQELGDLEDLRGFLHTTIDLVLRHLAQLQAERHVVVHRHVRIQRVVLEHHRDVPILRRNVVHDLVTDRHLPLRDVLETRDHPQHRRLATAGWPDQHQELAVLDDQIDTADCAGPIRIDLADVFEGDGCHGRSSKCRALRPAYHAPSAMSGTFNGWAMFGASVDGMSETNVAVVPGGTGSVGRELIPKLIDRGFNVAATYLIPEEATALEEQVDLDEDRLILRRVDCTDATAVNAFFDEAVRVRSDRSMPWRRSSVAGPADETSPRPTTCGSTA